MLQGSPVLLGPGSLPSVVLQGKECHGHRKCGDLVSWTCPTGLFLSVKCVESQSRWVTFFRALGVRGYPASTAVCEHTGHPARRDPQHLWAKQGLPAAFTALPSPHTPFPSLHPPVCASEPLPFCREVQKEQGHPAQNRAPVCVFKVRL